MSDKVWSQEQREAAADRFSGRMMWTQNIVDTIKLPCGDTVSVLRAGIEAECELTAKDAELAEAVELLRKLMRSETARIPELLFVDIRAILERNTPKEESDAGSVLQQTEG